MTKRVLSVVLVIVILLLSGCSGGGNNNSDKNSSNNNGTQNIHNQDKQTTEQIIENLFPSFKSARQIYVVDISNFEKSLVVFLRQMQGVVAKYDSAALYLVSNEQDRFWLNYMCDELGAYSTDVSVEEVVSLFSDYINTFVLYTPDTFEFCAAWNDAVRRERAVCIDYSVAMQFSLLDSREIIDIRGVFTSEEEAYRTLFEMIDIDSNNHSFVSLNENSQFIDYAIALDAFMLPTYTEDWSLEFTSSILSQTKLKHPGVVYTDFDCVEYITLFSENGFGNISVANFGNSTVFSSVKTSYVPDKIKTHNASPKKGNVYFSLMISTDTLGDAFDKNYFVCKAHREEYCVSIQYPVVLSHLAPATLLWYSLNTRQNDDSIISAGDWSLINYDSMPDDLYKKWHEINNELLSECGMRVSVADGFTESDLNNIYINYSKADGLVSVHSTNQDGFYAKPKSDPILKLTKVESLSEFEYLLSELEPESTHPLYYVFSLTADQYAEELPIYDEYANSNKPNGYYSITEIIAVANGNKFINFIVPEQMVNYIKKG